MTLGRFVKHVGGRVRQFLVVSLIPDGGCEIGKNLTVFRTANKLLSTIRNETGSGGSNQGILLSAR